MFCISFAITVALQKVRCVFMVIYLPELQDVVVRLVELLFELVHFVLQQKSSDCLILISPSQCCSETFCFSASRLAAIFSASSFLRFWMVSTCSVWNWREEICNSSDVMLSWIFSAFSSDLLVLELWTSLQSAVQIFEFHHPTAERLSVFHPDFP